MDVLAAICSTMIARSRVRQTVDVEQLVLLVVDEIALVGADDVPEELVVTLRHRVFGHVEQRLVVGGPGDVVDAFDAVRQAASPVRRFFTCSVYCR